MLALVRDLTPLVLGVLLTWIGATTLLDRSASQQTAAHALLPPLMGEGPATTAIRIAGWAELLVGLGLLGVPTHRMPAVGAVALGVGYAGILAYARLRPSAPAGATELPAAGSAEAGGTTVRWQYYVRAGLVVVGGLFAANAATPWWMAGGQHPVASFGIVVFVTLTLVALSAPIDQLWARHTPRRRLRLPHARTDIPLHAPDLHAPDLHAPDLGAPDLAVPDPGVPDPGVPDLGALDLPGPDLESFGPDLESFGPDLESFGPDLEGFGPAQAGGLASSTVPVAGRSPDASRTTSGAWTLPVPVGDHEDSPGHSSSQPS
ncbi:hypothetical protein ABN034_17380 [Actinopolymorpha sp. B11F2]|uniref:hypothetical protein n=1 Tax=Actinopolymorpha sp. B11F2 TaxID=3160862 RepID=UPI0032E51D49